MGSKVVRGGEPSGGAADRRALSEALGRLDPERVRSHPDEALGSLARRCAASPEELLRTLSDPEFLAALPVARFARAAPLLVSAAWLGDLNGGNPLPSPGQIEWRPRSGDGGTLSEEIRRFGLGLGALGPEKLGVLAREAFRPGVSAVSCLGAAFLGGLASKSAPVAVALAQAACAGECAWGAWADACDWMNPSGGALARLVAERPDLAEGLWRADRLVRLGAGADRFPEEDAEALSGAFACEAGDPEFLAAAKGLLAQDFSSSAGALLQKHGSEEVSAEAFGALASAFEAGASSPSLARVLRESDFLWRMADHVDSALLSESEPAARACARACVAAARVGGPEAAELALRAVANSLGEYELSATCGKTPFAAAPELVAGLVRDLLSAGADPVGAFGAGPGPGRSAWDSVAEELGRQGSGPVVSAVAAVLEGERLGRALSGAGGGEARRNLPLPPTERLLDLMEALAERGDPLLEFDRLVGSLREGLGPKESAVPSRVGAPGRRRGP